MICLVKGGTAMDTQKEHLRQQALRQLRLEQLTERNVELNRDLETLLSSNKNKRNYVLLAGLAGIFLYSLFLILVVSLFHSGDLSQMFTFFSGWTIAFILAFIGLCIPLYKIRKFNKSIQAQVNAYRQEIAKNDQEIAALRNT